MYDYFSLAQYINILNRSVFIGPNGELSLLGRRWLLCSNLNLICAVSFGLLWALTQTIGSMFYEHTKY